jgi:DNA-nicking Smr family endonuclease
MTMSRKKKDIFNPAFKDLKKVINRSKKEAGEKISHEPEIIAEIPDDKRYFDEAMADVTPISMKGKNRITGPGKNVRPLHPAPDEEKEVMDHLRGLLRGSIEMDITFSDEYIEGSITGVGRKTMKRLKRGEVPVQDHMDLHGLTKKEAEIEVRRFLVDSHKRGLRCVLIVHGRGLNSPDSFPVLKERLPVWLNRGPARRIVLAFATARPYDGGTGAIYVLLRRR